MSSGVRRNRLARESSPYLLLHATNPVDWHPWGEEAFEKARREDKPIFLSVGYSTCYWCHVMERECFSNQAIAAQLNQGFVSIKLDREERPDLDEIYMGATQLITQSGDWPNSLFLTHELKPFFAGTYFPPEDWHGRPGFPRVLAAIREAWDTRRAQVLEQAEAVAQAIRGQLGEEPAARDVDGREAAEKTLGALARRFDRTRGGFGQAPKFPSPSNLELLLDLARDGHEGAREMLVLTLDAMARGGINDQLAGGFHRYSTDASWLVPHFEKMLYDNASLAGLYAEAAPLAPGLGFERVARETLDFVLAELTGPEGGFLSAIDAETDGHEGAYYTWTREDLRQALDADQHALLASVYGFDGSPQFEMSRYVLHLPSPLSERARALGVSVEELLARLRPGREALLRARASRKRPLTDDKVLADWNGLMVAGMARAGRALDEPRYVAAAARAAAFVLERLRDEKSGALLHAWREGSAKVRAFLDDYAFLVDGLLALHAASGEKRWLAEARRLQDEQDLRLWDEAAGGYFMAGEDPRLLVRSKPAHDGATSSGNGVAALNLLELARLLGRDQDRARAEALLRAFSRGLDEAPLAHVTLVLAAGRLAGAEPGPGARGGKSGRRGGTDEREVVLVRASLGAPEQGGWRPFAIEVRVREGWHLNANPASQAGLVATEVRAEAGETRAVRYPEGQSLRQGTSAEEIRVYSGSVRIEGEVRGEAPRLVLVYQPCDETRCLRAVEHELRFAGGEDEGRGE